VTPRYCDVQQLDATIRCVYLSQTDTYLPQILQILASNVQYNLRLLLAFV